MATAIKTRRYMGNGTSLELKEELCVGCGDCAEVCPHGVLALVERPGLREGAGGRRLSAELIAILDRAACMECGACARNCPTSAMSVKAGVGCAAAIINGKLRGTAPNCDCGEGGCC